MPEDWEAIEAYRKTGYIREIEENLRKVYILDEYKKVVDEVKDRIKAELEKRYDDVKFSNTNYCLLSFTIKSDYIFELSLKNKDLYIYEYSGPYEALFDSFEELFKYIDYIIKEDK